MINQIENQITVDVEDDMAMVIGEPRLADNDVGLWDMPAFAFNVVPGALL